MLRELTGKEARRKRTFSCHFVLLRYSQVWGLTQATLSLWVLSREVYLAECLQSFYKRLSVCNFYEQGWHFGTVWHSRMFFEDYGKFFRTKFRVARFSFFPPKLSCPAALILTQQGKNAADLTGCLEKQTNLFGDVGIHVIVGGPFGLSGVHVEAGSRAQVV